MSSRLTQKLNLWLPQIWVDESYSFETLCMLLSLVLQNVFIENKLCTLDRLVCSLYDHDVFVKIIMITFPLFCFFYFHQSDSLWILILDNTLR